jgi:predicted lipoprotein
MRRLKLLDGTSRGPHSGSWVGGHGRMEIDFRNVVDTLRPTGHHHYMFVQRRMAIRECLKRPATALAVVLVVGTAAGCSKVPGVYTYVPAGQAAGGGQGPAAYDAKKYVSGIWSSKVLPTVAKDAVPATTLLPALEADQEGASKKYGNQAGTGSPYAFLLRGTGTVTGTDTESPSHPVTIKVDGLSGKTAIVQVVTGPVIAGTALRDGVKFIKFGDFTNQLNYADAATELNNKVKTEVLSKVKAADLVGKKVTFAGAFSLVAPGSVAIVPTELAAAS